MSMTSGDKGIVTAMAVAGALIVGSRWAQGKPLDAKVGVGAAFATIFLTTLYTYSPELGKGMTAIVLVTTIVVDGPPLFAAIGSVGTAPLGTNPATKLGPK
jgi:hypothetical protein